MESESKEDQIYKKLSDSVDRSAELIADNKPYEFAIKIKSLAQRKTQTSKTHEA